MKRFNYKVGKKGEEMARNYLAKKGYQILESNFATRFGEIDLVCAKDEKLIFVEVKLKIGEVYGTPEEMIDVKKVAQVRKTAQRFLLKNSRLAAKYPVYQIDAVCIVLAKDGSSSRIDHYESLTQEL